MNLVDKIAVLAEKYSVLPEKEKCPDTNRYLNVRKRWYLFGIIPIVRHHSTLWVVEDGDWWRVMVSFTKDRIIGADFRKHQISTMPEGDLIAWRWKDQKWNLVKSIDALRIAEHVKGSIELGYEQSCQAQKS
jgi:hypothetical protein